MKITVKLGDQAETMVDIPEEKAIDTFLKVVRDLHMAKGFVSTRDTIVNTIPAIKPNMDTEKGVVEIAKNIDQVREYVKNNNLIFWKCPECGRVQYSFAKADESKRCINCDYEQEFKNIKPAAYVCPKCNASSYLFVVDGLEQIPCKFCKADIDLVWHEKQEKYVSPNMLK